MKSLMAPLLMMTLLTYGANRENKRQAVYLPQPIAITKSVEQNKTTFYAYLPDNHRVTIFRNQQRPEIYSGYLCRIHESKLTNSVPVLGFESLLTIQKKKSSHVETQATCLIGPVKSKKLFHLYQHLFNTA